MEIVNKVIPKNQDLSILIMRIGVALVFLYGGLGKLFGILGGPGLENFSGMVWGSMAIATIVAIVELVAGISVLLGFMSRESNLLLAIIIAFATFMVHVPSGNVMNILVHVMLFTNLIGLVLLGSGKYAIHED